MLSSEKIKGIAKKSGADVCGIVPISRMKDAPATLYHVGKAIEVSENTKGSTAHHRSVDFSRATRPGETVPPNQTLPRTQWGYQVCLCGRKSDIACYERLTGNKI